MSTCHRHSWYVAFWQGKNVGFRCKCGGEVLRPMTPKEQRFYGDPLADLGKRVKADPSKEYQSSVHAIFHDFVNRFALHDMRPGWKIGKNKSLVRTKRKFRQVVDGKYRLEGYELMTAVAGWAKKFPHDVRIVRCDDRYHAGSDLLMIEHRTRDQYMGTTIIYIPQCSGDPPAEFFLYPGHRDGLMEALTQISRASKPVEHLEAARNRHERAFWRTVKPGKDAKPSNSKG